MLFSSIEFFVLLAVTLAAYWALPWQRARLGVLFVASIVFYAWYHWPSAFLLFGTIAFNYWAGLRVRGNARLLRIAIVLDLSLLFWFKYAAFVASQLGVSSQHLPRWLPLGISFFTFQVVAYLVDVYKGEIEAERSWLVFAVFKSYFAQLIAGPIVRGHDFLPQLREAHGWRWERAQKGAFLLLSGLGLKLGVADVLRQFADETFNNPAAQATSTAWLGLLAFSLQLFADFWGYSTMARGTAYLFGLELPINFNAPYIARSIQEFWRRWHITLSQWFRDYVYIPLGGNRSHRLRNLIVTMTVAGLWHGAGWNFVLWGFLHGAWQAIESKTRWRSWPTTALGVALLWVLFRARDMQNALAMYKALLLPPYRFDPVVPETLSIWLVGFALLHYSLTRLMEKDAPLKQAWVTLLLLLIALAYSGQKYDFVYFAF